MSEHPTELEPVRPSGGEGGAIAAPPEVDERSSENVMAELREEPSMVEQHAPGELAVREGYSLLAGAPQGNGRAVGVAISRFNGEITSRLLDSALAELEELGVGADDVTVLAVPGAFELPLAAMALARTRRYACVVALGCVIRGDTPHFDYVAGEAASGLQLAALETGIPVAFGLLTVENREQAEARIDRARDAVRSGLEMADVFRLLRATAAPATG